MEDAPGDLCGWFAGTELFRTAETFQEKIEQSRRVRLADLVRVAQTYLVPHRLVTVAVGPYDAKRRMERALAQTPTLLR
jgi:predicted Zn-dependent peptidase